MSVPLASDASAASLSSVGVTAASPSLPLAAARALVFAAAAPLAPVELPVAAARGAILARGVCAREPGPSADLSAVDGYAVPDAAPPPGAGWSVRGETPAGSPAAAPLAPGECVRVFTGAPLPPGTGRVLKAECVRCDGDRVIVLRVESADHCRRRGENHAAGAEVLAAGSRLGPLELALLAATGHTVVTVFPAPRVAHLVLGSELVDPAASPGPAQIRDTNSALIAALAAESGATLVSQRRVRDDPAVALAAARALPAHDVLILSGGAGHGRYDIACNLLAALGHRLEFRSLAIRPGKPLAFARCAGALAFALPGNPVAHWATWHLLVGPALRRLAGDDVPALPPRRLGRIETPWTLAAEEREVFWPARVTAHEHGWSVRPLRFTNSGDLAGVAGANALVCGGSAGGRWAAGDPIAFLPCA